MGKGNIPVSSILLVLLLVGVLGGCGLPGRASRNIGTGETLAVYGLEGRWAGPVTAEHTGCGGPATGLMSVGAGTFAFDPFQGTTVIKGTVKDSAFKGAFTRPGGGKQNLSINFTGSAREDNTGGEIIEGDLASGRCRWRVFLKRA